MKLKWWNRIVLVGFRILIEPSITFWFASNLFLCKWHPIESNFRKFFLNSTLKRPSNCRMTIKFISWMPKALSITEQTVFPSSPCLVESSEIKSRMLWASFSGLEMARLGRVGKAPWKWQRRRANAENRFWPLTGSCSRLSTESSRTAFYCSASSWNGCARFGKRWLPASLVRTTLGRLGQHARAEQQKIIHRNLPDLLKKGSENRVSRSQPRASR